MNTPRVRLEPLAYRFPLFNLGKLNESKNTFWNTRWLELLPILYFRTCHTPKVFRKIYFVHCIDIMWFFLFSNNNCALYVLCLGRYIQVYAKKIGYLLLPRYCFATALILCIPINKALIFLKSIFYLFLYFTDKIVLANELFSLLETVSAVEDKSFQYFQFNLNCVFKTIPSNINWLFICFYCRFRVSGFTVCRFRYCLIINRQLIEKKTTISSV